jgi:hypothetical protein
MHQRHQHRRFVFCGFLLVFALIFALPTWVAADTTPTSVGVGASVPFTGTGFAPNEALSVWENAPDGTIVPLTGVQTDGSGAFTISVSFPSAGAWTVTAHSINTGKEFLGSYAVGTTSSTTTSPTTTAPILGAPAAPSSGATAQGTSVAVSAFTTFSGTGFNANEVISAWETGPDSAVTALPGLQADGNGAFTESVSFPTAGQWQVTAHGITSGHEVITPFAVGVPGGAPASVASAPPATTGAVGGPGFNGTPTGTGAVTTFSGSGFTANERISLWTTAPDSTTAALSGIDADGTGAFTTSVIFPTAGNWQVTAQGHDSAHQVIGRYAVSDSFTGSTTTAPATNSTFTSPFAGVPVKATVGTISTFTGTGFNAGETVSAWATPPDGSAVTTLDQVQASSTGQATVSTSFGSVGLWQVTLQGHSSGHVVVGKFQVATT